MCDLGCGPAQVAQYPRDIGSTIFLGMVTQALKLNPDVARLRPALNKPEACST